MQFIYSQDASKPTIIIESELHKYLFKIRRHKIADDLYFRNLQDKNIYRYKVEQIDRRKTTLKLLDFEEKIVEPKKKLHIGWCVIDPKSVEKVIASLNELGVTKITFIMCRYSQKQYKPNFTKLEKLLINSSSQCGRSSIIELDICKSLESFVEKYPQSFLFNFSKNNIYDTKTTIDTILLGCEGGFSKEEIDKFQEEKIVGIDSNLILRSETAVVTIASIVIT